jgi:amino acid transporter
MEVSSPPDWHKVIDFLLIYFLVALLLDINKERKERKRERERGTYYRLIVIFALALAICLFFKLLVFDNFVFAEYT